MKIKLLTMQKLLTLSFEYDLAIDTPESIVSELKTDLGYIGDNDLMRIKKDIRMVIEKVRTKTQAISIGDDSHNTSIPKRRSRQHTS